jgi:hypothetical protein
MALGNYFGRAAQTNCTIPRSAALSRQGQLRQLIAELKRLHPTTLIYDTFDALCDASNCIVKDSNMLRYRDSHHLSMRGSEMVARHFLNWLKNQSQN